jgi:glycosyltransferase involved in cell wall biosynthesis
LASARGRVLAVFPDHLHPLDMGSRVRNYRICEALAGAFDLTVVSLVHDRRALSDPGPVVHLGRWVPVPASHRRSRPHQLAWHLRALCARASGGIGREAFFKSLPALSRTVEALVREEKPDLVHAAYWYTLRRLRPLPRPPLWIVDTHDVQFERRERGLSQAGPAGEKRHELDELSRYDRIIAITERDRETLGAHLPPEAARRCEVIGMGLDMEAWSPSAVVPALSSAPRVSFYGNLAVGANKGGALHLLHELLPPLRRRFPGLEALILGAGPDRELAAEARSASALLPGFVDDVRPWLLSAGVLALSVRSGTGQRGRVVEALALGIPVVGYAEALQGLELSEGEGIMPAGSFEEFLASLTRLLRDPAEAVRLGRAGREAVARRYSLDATYGKFPSLYRRLLETKKPRDLEASGSWFAV